ncbi:MAG: ribonuclease Z [Gemmatimonadetes bacterium]|nr:ribonuclease Z [Gemmatimonadota bacterium]
MRLTAVGTGTAAPTAHEVNAGWYLEAGPVRLLVDCGSGVVHGMAKLGLDWAGITHLALTHFHADHISDIATLVTAWKYGQMVPRTAPLEVIGPPGTLGMLERTAALFGSWMLEPGFPLMVHELDRAAPDLAAGAVAGHAPASPAGAGTGENAVRRSASTRALPGGLELSALPVPHTPESVAYSMARGARRIVYTGDTGPDDALGAWAAGCDVLVAECSLPRVMAVPGHLTPEDCAAMAAAARPHTLVLTHRFPPVGQVDAAGIVRERFAGTVVLAHDGWSIDLQD